MRTLTETGRRLRRIMGGGPEETSAVKRALVVVVSVLVVIGASVGALLATAGGNGGKPAALSRPDAAISGVPSARPTPAKSTSPVVPLLGANTEGHGSPMAAPVASALAATGTTATRSVPVAPLHGLRQADLLVVAPFSLSAQVLAAVKRQPAVASADPVEAAKIQVNGTYTAVLGVDPSTFRSYAAQSMATSDSLWRGVANGGVAVSYTMGTLDKLSLGGRVAALGRTQERLPVVAFGTVGIGGVDAVVSDATARSLGMPAANAIVISAPSAHLASLVQLIKKVLPSGAGVEPLVTQVTTSSSAGTAPSSADGIAPSSAAGIAPSSAAASGPAITTAQMTTALRAAESRRGLPYVWGAAGPTSFDCSGLVQWSFAQAGVSMPRVAADQARTGAAVPVSQLQPGDLLFYHTDPTDPGYISHVAIYLGNGWMIQAPQPGMDVEVVPASFGSQFAGAVRIDPHLAASIAGGLA